MSGNASGWVLRNGPHPDHVGRDGRRYGARARGLRFVLFTVADAANFHGEHAHPGLDSVARFSLYSRRQAIRLLADLEADGWVEVERAGGGHGLATVYCIPGVRKGDVASPLSDANSDMSEQEGCHPEPKTVTSEAETVTPGCHPNGLFNGLEANGLTQPSFADFWNAYAKHRDKKQAEDNWKDAIKKADPAVIVVAAQRYSAETGGEFMKDPHRWLKDERWTDEPGANMRGNGRSGRPAPLPKPNFRHGEVLEA